ncbi:MAG: 5-(carboxyamino)imidazole ribonucleotide synthase [Scytolyngbya sp. HA4215-MV1]|jgi:5-(carboxyamino)imidazole ribonucleotide synthase|nr:5-(carboxyamino)imidazole ribonucleotide synthase [Scytolyngbya sp. HA4215-MV1]
MFKRVGVIGGGQLAWMMAEPAKQLGIELVVQTPHLSDPAVAIASDTVLATLADATATAQLAAKCDVITFENEFVDLPALRCLAERGTRFYPSLDSLSPLLDKYDQRCYLKNLGLPVPNFTDFSSFEHSLTTLEFPLVLKTRRHGYDGQGTFILSNLAELQAALTRLPDVPLLLEEFVPFDRELAVIAARSIAGEMVVYPVVETQQEHQVCRRVIAPAQVSVSIMAEIEAIARTLLPSLDAVGIFGIELFLTPSGQVLVNEIAPRTHNSGHYTIDACATSQFEQHLRAICGLPLGSPHLICAGAVMVNLLGYENASCNYWEKRQQLLAIPNAHLHWYGKTESRIGRKLGHVTVTLEACESLALPQQVATIAQRVEALWYDRRGNDGVKGRRSE